MNNRKNLIRSYQQKLEGSKMVLAVLREEVVIGKYTSFTNKTWAEMLESMGYEEKDWLNWHRDFEFDCLEEHYKFLKSINMSEEEINDLLEQINKEN